ncbi:DNA polymerase [Aeromonas phage BUCT695]|uniref:DNA polymerase n=1 Tax=Aeromonas phage BUCT695 TaxID=2908630 RepID=UPI00232959AD|nr:DNA polymerase [Aeromonas phage BUCT695]UIW10532.1 DNA polymerase [Aeromonas phage BUCT695]
MKIYVTDIEGNNLYEHITLFHCAWIIDALTGERWGFRPHQLAEYIAKLGEADILVGHNLIDFDLPALKKLHGFFPSVKVFDTLVLSRMLEPDRIQGHSLKQWGISLGILKGDYGEQENAWEEFTEPMFVYCEQDVEVTLVLFKHLCKLAGFDYTNPPASKLEF